MRVGGGVCVFVFVCVRVVLLNLQTMIVTFQLLLKISK